MIISPSILSADFSKLNKDIKRVNKAKMLHIDVMDGVFVPNISFGAKVQKDIRDENKMVFDTHLMIIDPIKYIEDFAKAGSDYITFHIESNSDATECINKIKSYNVKAGISIKPATPVSAIEPYLSELDLILVMSVEPGFGGQKFMPSAVDKIKELDSLRKKNNYHYLISVDGGINDKTILDVRAAGVDIAVAGSYLFKQKKPNKIIDSFNKL